MHEHKIVNKIIEEAKKIGVERFIELEVGELAEFCCDELKEELQNHVDWEIKFNERESKVKCECGYLGRANILDKGHGYCIFNCPICLNKPEVLEGGEIKIIGAE